MRRFTVSSEGSSRLGLRELCQRFADNLWVPDHLTDEQAAAFALDQFRRTVLAELEMLGVSCEGLRA
jgi:hypothetical protein